MTAIAFWRLALRANDPRPGTASPVLPGSPTAPVVPRLYPRDSVQLCTAIAGFILGLAMVVLAAFPAPAFAQDANACDQAGESPDIVVGDIWGGVARFGNVGGITAYGFGSDACNLGTCWASFVANTSAHPIFGQNMFRLKNGRFEQIGQSWVKHTFGADQYTTCSNFCIAAPNATHLGVNCSDAYAPSQNGGQANMGPKSEINAFTGGFPYPFAYRNQTGNAIYKRLQVHDTDLDLALNPGAQYYVEIQYISPDDASGGLGANNCSYRRVSVLPGSAHNLVLEEQTHRQEAAIQAWGDVDLSVLESVAGVSQDGIFRVASKATFLGQGRWHYEYAVQNIDVSKGAIGFQVPIPSGATVTNIGFHDVDYHSGELYDNVDWISQQTSGVLLWSVAEGDESSWNALRWGTLYNFRFDADVPPGTVAAMLSLPHPIPGSTETPPTGTSATAAVFGPSRCDSDGMCDLGETCASCPADCANQHGGGGCCGNLICEVGEDATGCFSDCGTAAPLETHCTNGIDDDRDGLLDCVDPDCCNDASCSPLDPDGDLFGACDCNNADSTIWSIPGEVLDLAVSKASDNTMTLVWDPVGGGRVTYDLLRTTNPGDVRNTSQCLFSTVTALIDNDVPNAGGVLAYLVRGKNACPNGVGTLGTDSAGHEINGPSCP